MEGNEKGKAGDAVAHPPHYTFGKIEVISVIEDWKLGFHLGSAVKYIARAGKKDPTKLVEDLRKARWYLDRLIAEEERKIECKTANRHNTNRSLPKSPRRK